MSIETVAKIRVYVDSTGNFAPRWPEEKMERLKELWEAGHSARQIGKELGMSRNAIIGKKNRMGLPQRPIDAARPKSTTPRKKYPRRKPQVRPPTACITVNVDDSAIVGVTINDLEWSGGNPSNCRSILRYDKMGAIYCGQPVRLGESFCEGHCMRYFTPGHFAAKEKTAQAQNALT